MFTTTPYIWDEEAKHISSATLKVGVLNDTIGMAATVRLPNTNQNTEGKNIVLAFPANGQDATDQAFFVKVNWKSPSDNLYISVDTGHTSMSRLNHNVYIRKDEGPTAETFDWSKEVTSSDWSGSTFSVMVNGGFYDSPTVAYVAVRVYTGKLFKHFNVTFYIIDALYSFHVMLFIFIK